MNKQGKLILVTGATGKQGGASARHLLANGWTLRALVRNPQKPAAQALAAKGVELAQGDLYDRASLDAALKGVYGVFSVQNFWLPDVGFDGEIRQGNLLADAAKAAHVPHFVYTSVGGAERKTGIPHFDSKWKIEEHIHAVGLPATIFRPVFFMDNFFFPWTRPQVLNGVLPGIGLRPDKTMQLIAVDDIGAFTALAFEQPETYVGKALEIAGDELTESQIAAAFSKVIGRPVSLVAPTVPPGTAQDSERQKMTRWFNDAGYRADIPALRAICPGLRSFETWLHETGWENAQPEPQTQNTWGQS